MVEIRLVHSAILAIARLANVGAVALIAAVALNPKMIVALSCQSARARCTLEQSLCQRYAHWDAVIALLNERRILILVDVAIHFFARHRER